MSAFISLITELNGGDSEKSNCWIFWASIPSIIMDFESFRESSRTAGRVMPSTTREKSEIL